MAKSDEDDPDFIEMCKKFSESPVPRHGEHEIRMGLCKRITGLECQILKAITTIARAHDERSSVARTVFLQGYLDNYVTDCESRRADLERQLMKAKKDIRLLEEENSEVKDACAEWTALAQRMRKALRELRNNADYIEARKGAYHFMATEMILIIDKALDGDGGQEKRDAPSQ